MIIIIYQLSGRAPGVLMYYQYHSDTDNITIPVIELGTAAMRNISYFIGNQSLQDPNVTISCQILLDSQGIVFLIHSLC